MPAENRTTGERDREATHHGCLWVLLVLPFVFLARTIGHLPTVVAEMSSMRVSTGPGEATERTALDPPQDAAARDAVLAAISAADPRFDATAVAQRTATAYAVVQRSLVDLDASPARTVLGDGFWRLHRMMVELRRRAGITAHRVVRVTGSRVLGAERTVLVETLRVALSCEGECYEVAANGTILRGDVEYRAWEEVWTLRRAASATTPAHGGLLAGVCPTCGAALQITDRGACAFCRNLVMAGGFDWVVVDVERDGW